MPGVNMPKPSQFFTCPDLNSVKGFGAAGNGRDDDSGKLQQRLYVAEGDLQLVCIGLLARKLHVMYRRKRCCLH